MDEEEGAKKNNLILSDLLGGGHHKAINSFILIMVNIERPGDENHRTFLFGPFKNRTRQQGNQPV